MPHFGLMDEEALGPIEAPLMRARLHIRGGKRRLRQGKISDGLITLYDAFNSALQWYVALPERREKLSIKGRDELIDEAVVYSAMISSGLLDGSFDYSKFDALVEKALKQQMPDYNYKDILQGLEWVMTQLGVMPFDEKALPPEHPATF